MTISEFLEARIAEDEARANLTADTSPAQSPTARWAVARVLAECVAKRKILALHSALTYSDEDPRFPIEPATCLCKGAPCPTLTALAASYSDHPAFLREWVRGHDLAAKYAVVR
ncbi:DUF6221 family protein [Arthrobacter sp. G.S.26]|uniref:DUF6221 family protein n=1 Tax=Arthrobacter sp. G.S.26 TaxID=3433706 RepID=UPI003D7837F8